MNITKFDPQKLKDNFFMYVVGMRRSGKTTIIKDIIKNSNKKFDEVYLISETATLSHDYDDYVKENHIFELNESEKVLTTIEKQQKAQKNPQLRNSILFILDDVVTSDNRDTWDKLAFMGRHLKVHVILLSQSMKAISPLTRKNADYALFSASRSYDDIEAFLKQYLTGSSSNDSARQSFIEAMQIYNYVVKEPHVFLVVDNSAQTRNINEFVFHYKANPEISKFNIYTGKKQKLENGLKFSDLYKSIKNNISVKDIEKNVKRNKRLKSSPTIEQGPRAIIPEHVIKTNFIFSRTKKKYDFA
jgi:AAA+ ATPase superfamily predicted ATPase